MGPTLKEFQAELAKGQSLFLDTARHGSSVTVKMERNLVWLDLLIWKFCSLEDIVRKYAAQRDRFFLRRNASHSQQPTVSKEEAYMEKHRVYVSVC